ncbi:c-type cytochrome biogenesis protein CcmI [Betaproteobacteria bacterium GR16-43]|nr:c-type cytochrome biogenesis protein CcmI [Betaproteobacteria bacterium GR16-43]
MVVFWLLAALMTGGALAFVLVPLLRNRPRSAPSPAEANLEALRAQRREIEADIASGVLPAESRDEALGELVARADAEIPAPAPGSNTPNAPIVPPRRPWIVAAIAGVLLPVLAVGLYLGLGNPRGLDPKASVAANPAAGVGDERQFDDKQILAMVETLAQKVRDRPDDVQGWSLLARSMNALGRYPEAVDAYEHLMKLVPNNPDVMSDYADALAMKQGRNLSGRPYELVRQALKVNPAHQKSLALAGTAAMNDGDYAASVRYWQLLGMQLPQGSEDSSKVASIIAEVRGRAAAAGKPLPGGPAPPLPAAMPPPTASAPPMAAAPGKPSAPTPAPSAVPGGGTVSGLVTVAPQLIPKIAPTDTLFIYARAESGPRMPLAILRGGAREVPKSFVLDDTMAMAPGMKLSTTAAVIVEARISKSGNAMPQPGDLVGTSAVLKPGARDVKIVIDRVLP